MEDASLSPQPRGPGLGPGLVVALIFVAFVAGTLGGGIAAVMLSGGDSRAASSVSDSAPQPTFQEDSAMVDTVNKVGPAVVTIVTEINGRGGLRGSSTPEIAAGSGFIIDSRGYIVTNAHVVRDARSLTVVFADGRRLDGRLVGTDEPFSDLAVIKVDEQLSSVVDLGDSDALTPGQPVLAIGNALGDYRNTVTQGIVSGLHRTWRGEAIVMEDLIQTDAAINHGNSGGPLVNAAGQIIGVNTSVIRQTQGGQIVEGIGFAIPSNTVKLVASQLVKNGKVTRPYLGISHQQINPAMASFYSLPVPNGVFILQVAADGPAAAAGLQRGDILVRMGNDPMDDEHPFLSTLMKHYPNEKLTLVVNRDGKEIDMEVTLGERQ